MRGIRFSHLSKLATVKTRDVEWALVEKKMAVKPPNARAIEACDCGTCQSAQTRGGVGFLQFSSSGGRYVSIELFSREALGVIREVFTQLGLDPDADGHGPTPNPPR